MDQSQDIRRREKGMNLYICVGYLTSHSNKITTIKEKKKLSGSVKYEVGGVGCPLLIEQPKTPHLQWVVVAQFHIHPNLLQLSAHSSIKLIPTMYSARY